MRIIVTVRIKKNPDKAIWSLPKQNEDQLNQYENWEKDPPNSLGIF